MFFLVGNFVSSLIWTLKSKKPKNLTTFSNKPRFFPALILPDAEGGGQYFPNWEILLQLAIMKAIMSIFPKFLQLGPNHPQKISDLLKQDLHPSCRPTNGVKAA